MAASIIGALRAVLGLDTAQFEQNADRASSKSGVLKRELMGMASAVGGMVAPAALATAGVAAFAKGMEAAQAAMDFADELDATATKIGVTAESLQSLRFAAQDADIDASTFDSTLQSLNATLGAMKSGIGDTKVREAFDKLGIGDDQLQSMRDATDLLPLLADRISKVGSQAEQVKIAKKLGVEDMLPLLQRGSEGVRALQEEFKALGLELSNETISRLADLSREVEKADSRMSVASVTIGGALAPAFATLKNGAADLVNWLARVVDQFNKVENRATETLRQQRFRAHNAMLDVQGWASGPNRDEALAAANKQIADLDRELSRRFDKAKQLAAEGAASSAGSGGGSGLSTSDKKSAKKKGEDWSDWFSQARKARQDYNDSKAISDRINAAALGEIIDPKSLQVELQESTFEAVQAGFEEARRTVYDAYRDTMAGAIEAGVRGGWGGIAQWFGWQLSRTLVDQLSTMGANAATGGGLLGKAFTSIGSLFGIGNNADGTTNWRGGMTWVGERGPELLSLPRGAAITPAHMVDAGGGGLLVGVTPSPLFDVTVRKVSREEAQSAAIQSTQAGMGLAQEQQARAAFTRIR